VQDLWGRRWRVESTGLAVLVRQWEGDTSKERRLREISCRIAQLGKKAAGSHREQRASEQVHADVGSGIARTIRRIHMERRAGTEVRADLPRALKVVVDVEVRIDVAKTVVRPEHHAGLEVNPGSTLFEFQVSPARERCVAVLGIDGAETTTDTR